MKIDQIMGPYTVHGHWPCKFPTISHLCRCAHRQLFHSNRRNVLIASCDVRRMCVLHTSLRPYPTSKTKNYSHECVRAAFMRECYLIKTNYTIANTPAVIPCVICMRAFARTAEIQITTNDVLPIHFIAGHLSAHRKYTKYTSSLPINNQLLIWPNKFGSV